MLGVHRVRHYALVAWDVVQARFREDEAQTLAEYGLVLTVIAVGVVLPTMIILRGEIAAAFASGSACLLGSC